jgi:hypothetical protein
MMQRMKMKGFAATAVALALTLGGVALAAPASATDTPAECVPSEAIPAWTEVTPDIEHPAVGEPTITIDNPDYVPAVEYQPAVYAIEYEFVHKFDVLHVFPKWKTDPNWNAESNPQSKGWIATGNTRDGELITPEVPAADAIGEPTIVVDNPDYVAAYTEDVPDIEHPEVPAVTCPPVEEEPACQANLFDGFEDRGGLWEITYGTQHTDVNGVAVFTNDSFGGLVAFNGGEIPSYMTGAEYRWLYVYGDEPGRTWTWDFADNTRVTAVASYTEDGCPVVAWSYGTTPELPELPADEIVFESPVYTVECGAEIGDVVPATVAWTSTTYTRGEDGQPVASSSTGVNDTEHVVTQADLDMLECETPIVDPEPTTPDAEPAPAGDPADSADFGDRTTDETVVPLAATGSTIPLPLLGGGLIALLLGALGVTVAAARRR